MYVQICVIAYVYACEHVSVHVSVSVPMFESMSVHAYICECLQKSEVNLAVIHLVFAAVVVVIFVCWVLFCLVFERICIISLENANSNRMAV